MNNITRDHTPFAQARARDHKHACFLNLTVFDLLACMYIQLLIIKNKSSSIL